jgi:hypothetical protein
VRAVITRLAQEGEEDWFGWVCCELTVQVGRAPSYSESGRPTSALACEGCCWGGGVGHKFGVLLFSGPGALFAPQHVQLQARSL